MNWKKGPIIGRGSSATVFLATTATGDRFAVKSAELSTSLFLQKEQQFLSKLRHPRIIDYIGYDVDYINNIPMYNLFMEYAPFGTISDVIKKQSGCLDECLIRSYTHQILLGLDYLHSNNFVHCDIKCQNLMVTNDGVKIGDLGCTKLVEDGGDNTSSVFSGTPVFMAPEVARGEEQGFAADIWALGCAVIEMATGCNPWPEIKDPVSALYRIGYSGDVPLIPASLSVEAKDFLKNCFEIKTDERWTAKELLQHPFVSFDCNSKKIETFPKNSPSSILDQGFWDSFEVTDSSLDPTLFTNLSCESPVDRIRQLVDATSSLPNLVDEEDWITVRSNQIDESLNKNLQQNLYTDEDVEDDYSESTSTDTESFSEVYIEEGFSIEVRMMLESDVVETSDANVVSRNLDCKNVNDDNCLLVDSNTWITLFDSAFIFIQFTCVTNEFTFQFKILNGIILANEENIRHMQ